AASATATPASSTTGTRRWTAGATASAPRAWILRLCSKRSRRRLGRDLRPLELEPRSGQALGRRAQQVELVRHVALVVQPGEGAGDGLGAHHPVFDPAPRTMAADHAPGARQHLHLHALD